MAQIDERVVAMSFETAKFDAGVQKTLGGLKQLSDALNNMSKLQGLDQLEKSANKVTLTGPMSALDKLKGKLGMTTAGTTFTDMENAAAKVTLNGPMSALDRLKTKLGSTNAGTTFTDMENAANRVSFEGLTRALQNVGSQFSVLEGAAAVALGNIVSKAATAGAQFAKSFTFDPAKQGFEEYQTNLGSIQTVLANTSAAGTNLGDVNSALQTLNKYSDQTIYNFGEMAKNIGTFTAAGVDLGTATTSIKGIANLAALSGSNSAQASTAMYQLSQAISSGKVGLQDWNSVVNAGMGGTVFQRALAQTAESMGVIEKGAVKLEGPMKNVKVNGMSFRDSMNIAQGGTQWLTSDVLVKTLQQFSGELSNADLAAQGFSASQIKAIQSQATMAQHAATEVKTLPQVFDIAKETIGSGWSTTFQTIFGNFSEAKNTFTDLSNTINGFINTNSSARNKVLKVWKDLGGRTDLIEGIKNAFKALTDILRPIRDAFREIFPATTGRQLADMTEKFRQFTESMRIDPATAENIKRTFAGIFAIFDIAKRIVGGLIGVIFDLLGAVGQGSGGFLGFTGGIGDFLVALDNAIAKGNVFKGFFTGLTSVIKLPFTLLIALGKAIGSLFTGGNESAAQTFTDSIGNLNEKLGPLSKVVDLVKRGLGGMQDLLGKLKAALDPWFAQMADKLSTVGDIIANAFEGLDYDQVMSGLQTGLIAGILVALKKALGFDSIVSIGKPFEGINKVLSGFTGQMEAMQSKLHAEALLAIAGAVAVLAAGLFVLSKIPADALSKALTAAAVGLGELMGAMKLITGGMGKMGLLQLPVISASIIGLALAVTILAGAMKIFATMSWEDIAKGMAGVAGSLVGIAAGMKLMGGGPNLAIQAAGLILIGVALNIIAAAVKVFSTMKWEDLVKGMFGVVEALGGIALGVSMMPPTLPLTAAGLVLVGIALNGIAVALKTFASIDILSMLTGLGGMAGALVAIGLAIGLFPPTIALQAAGLVLLGQAMVVIAGAIALMGNLKIETMVKGIAAMGAALVVLALGLNLMSSTLPGAAGLLAAAAALAVLAPTLGYLGTLSWGTILKGLAAIAATIIVVGLASTVAAPGLIELGIALIPLGIGMAAVAAAVYLFAKALSLLGEAGPKSVAVVIAALTGFVAFLPKLVISFVKGLLDIVSQLTVLLPKVVVALGVVIDTIIAFVIAKAPELATAIGVLIDSFLSVLVTNTPKIIAAGFKLLLDFMSGVSQNIGQITTKATDIIVNFLNALTTNMPRIIAAGANLIASFISGIASKAAALSAMAANLIGSFLSGIAANVGRIISRGASIITAFISGIGSYIGQVVDTGAHVIIKLLAGLAARGDDVVRAAVRVITHFLRACAQAMLDLTNEIADIIVNFLNGLADAIRNNDDRMIDAGANVMDALKDGMLKAAGRMAGPIKKALDAVFSLLPGWAKKILGIHSPSSIFTDIGIQTMAGMAKGISDGGSRAVSSMSASTSDIVSTAQGTLGKVPDMLSGIMDVDPTITPVLDLSNVHKEAQNMPDLAKVIPITAAASYDQASNIAQAQKAAAEGAQPSSEVPTTTLHFEQHNHSPEALSEIEIYRQTNNQISLAKSELGIAKPRV